MAFEFIRHVVPGTFFILFSLWWMVNIFWSYFVAILNQKLHGKKENGYKNSISFTCDHPICCSKRSLHYVWFSWSLSHLKMSKNVLLVVARLPQRLKSTFFEIFSHSAAAPFENFSKNVDFRIWSNRATTRAHIIYCTIFPFLAHQYIYI